MKPDAKTQQREVRQFLRCRICWKVALATFFSILIVEAIILVPSYHNYARDWQLNRASQSLAAVRGAISSARDKDISDPAVMAERLDAITQSRQLMGWRLHPVGNGKQLASSGELPQNLLGRGLTQFRSSHTGFEVLDVVWTEEALGAPFNVQARLNIDGLTAALNAFVWRVSGLIAIISLVATVVTIFVLNRQVLRPVLNLRAHLKKAGDGVDDPEALIVTSRRNDELDDVVEAFNDMLVQIGNNLRTIQVNEKELHKARDNLEQRVLERTRALYQEIQERCEVEKRLRKKEQHLYKSANYDDLTRLPNRLLGLDRLRQALEHTKRHGCFGALMFIDLDNFKEINDTMGHGMGDELLLQTAQRLASALRGVDSVIHLEENDYVDSEPQLGRREDIVARIGGDEFMVILPEISDEGDAATIAHRLSQACSEPFDLNHHEVFVTASIGIAVFPRDGSDPQELMMCADTALYAVKDLGRNGYRFFSSEMNSKLVERLEIESQLRHALDNEEFKVFYQPVVDVETQQLVAVEALLRWENSQLGTVSPDDFIAVAEGTGVIIPVGEWVLREACEAAKVLERAGYPLRVAINVSTRQFRGAHFVDSVSKALAESSLAPDRLELEITESLLVDEQSEAIETIKRLRDFGVRLSIDDFGTGYSALSYLRRFAVNTLKIDRSFVAGVIESEQDASLARTIIAMAQNLGLEIVAEGVENKKQLEFLQHHECHYAQGYYFGKPMSLSDLLSTLGIPKVI